ncbi:preprotein translocase subunit SecG [Candidatus Wolfebacteria bacterium]|nr:preprotein translocase subunit SecG [Candidatus Wolfebacteria bacterium]
MYISIAQVIISIVLIVLILLQERSSGLSGIFGGGENDFYSKRRGMERSIFITTIILIIAFGVLSILSLII